MIENTYRLQSASVLEQTSEVDRSDAPGLTHFVLVAVLVEVPLVFEYGAFLALKEGDLDGIDLSWACCQVPCRGAVCIEYGLDNNGQRSRAVRPVDVQRVAVARGR